MKSSRVSTASMFSRPGRLSSPPPFFPDLPGRLLPSEAFFLVASPGPSRYRDQKPEGAPECFDEELLMLVGGMGAAQDCCLRRDKTQGRSRRDTVRGPVV